MAQKANPKMPIILCKLPPRLSPTAPIDPNEVLKLDAAIEDYAKGKSYITVFDLYGLFATPDGKPDPVNYKEDLLHPSDVGYVKMGQALGKIFDDLKLQ
jgi:lysophospholipase L1-like esterase